ncbi:MAG TPA: membrane protein insertase YidC [Acidimicrobiales bacterium]|nr:membrane protein insertase YidC [Acidimicrobiales bacterium]
MHSITHFVGGIFQPIFHAVAWLLAFLYGLIPNYAIAIALLTLIIMGLLTPFTVKSTRSMISMQRLQPEIKKIQQKYKGPENRQLLNDEMMKLYREEGVNPLGGCLPVLLQAPFLFILYSVIKGLALTVTSKSGVIKSTPRYIPHSSKMYENLVHSLGHINVWGMDLSLRPFPISAHGSTLAAIPFFVFVAVAVGMQYFQMAQMNNLSRKRGQAMPSQQLMMQRVLPIVFAYFYLVIPAAVVLYMIISTGIRIITQDIMFRTGVSNPNKNADREKPAEREIPAGEPIEGVSEVIEKPEAKPSTPKPTNQPRSNNRPKSQPRPAPKPQSQARSKAKRKRKAR